MAEKIEGIIIENGMIEISSYFFTKSSTKSVTKEPKRYLIWILTALPSCHSVNIMLCRSD